MDEKKYKLICVRKGKTNYARTNNRKNVTLGSYNRYLTVYGSFALFQVRSPTSFASSPPEVTQVCTHLSQLALRPSKIIFVLSTELIYKLATVKSFKADVSRVSPLFVLLLERMTNGLSFALTKG